ncbi:MAG TPA: trigger factor [Ktedonobacterales bacterium]|nr:trigger factor [Ktedonobacterales bacterium]
MKVTVERTPESEAVLTIQMDWDEVETATNKAYKRLAQRYNVPGFRKGHAPRSMIERMLGKEAVYQEGLDDLIDAAYRNALVEHDLTPLTQPHADAPSFEEGQPYSAQVHVPVLTPATLGEYKAIRVEPPAIEITDEQVEQTVERLREQQAIWEPVERGAQSGDQVTMDLKLTAEGREKPISDLHDNEFVLTDERVGIFTGMDEHIAGMKEGDTKAFTTTIPEDYSNPELAGKEAQYEVAVKAVKQRELPEANDEFAATVGDYTTMDEVRQAIREQLRTQRLRDAERELSDEVTKRLIESSTYTIHPLLVEDEANTMMRETARMLEDSRLSLQQFLEASGKTEDEYRKELEPDATERVKRDLALAALASAEQVEVDDEEAGQWFEMMSMLSGGRRSRWRDLSASQRRAIIARLRRDKALSRMISIATEGRWPPAAEEATEEATEEAEAGAKAAAQATEVAEAE